MASALDPQQLLQHTDWVNTLARGLVSDAARADDIAQSALLAALEAPPREQGNLRAWLTTVVQNLARKSGRSAARIERRETRAARAEALPSTAELVELAERQRELAARVLELSEPYRTTLLLRFYQGLTAEEIAERSSTPIATVRSRIQRAQALLREELDARYGGREAWCLAFLPLARLGLPAQGFAVAASAGVLIMSTKWILTAAAGIAAIAMVAVWSQKTGPMPDAVALTADEPARISKEELGSADDDSKTGAQRATAGAAPEKKAKQPVAPRLETIRGQAITLDQQPVAGLELRWRQAALGFKGRTDAEGRFTFELPGKDGKAELVDATRTILTQFLDAASGEHLVVVAPAVDIAGSVVRENGELLADADVEAWLPSASDELTQFIVRHGNRFGSRSTKSDAQGRFLLKGVPNLKGTRLSSRRGGLSGGMPMPSESRDDLQLVLSPTEGEGERVLAGLVQGADGLPIQGASVSFGQDFKTTDSKGRFEIPISYFKPHWKLTVSHKQWQPHLDETIAEKLQQPGTRLENLVITLQRPLPAIEGMVVDADGKPCAGWSVDLSNPTDWGNSSATVEQISSGKSGLLVTDANGQFRIAGLFNRSYRVYALDMQKSMLRVESDEVWPGTKGLVLRVPDNALVPELKVRVVDTDGQPVADGQLMVETVVGNMDGTPVTWSKPQGVTDAQGLATLRAVPRNHVRISVSSRRKLQPTYVDYDADRMGTELLLTVMRLRQVVLKVRPDAGFDNIQFLDAKDQVLDLEQEFAGAVSGGTQVPVDEEGTPLIRVPGSVRTLRLRQGDREVRRMPVPPAAGETTAIEL